MSSPKQSSLVAEEGGKTATSSGSGIGRQCFYGAVYGLVFGLVSILFFAFVLHPQYNILVDSAYRKFSSNDGYLPYYSIEALHIIEDPRLSLCFEFSATIKVKNPSRVFAIVLRPSVLSITSDSGVSIESARTDKVTLGRHGTATFMAKSIDMVDDDNSGGNDVNDNDEGNYDNDDNFHNDYCKDQMLSTQAQDGGATFELDFGSIVREARVGWFGGGGGRDLFSVTCRVTVDGLSNGSNVTASSCHSSRPH